MMLTLEESVTIAVAARRLGCDPSTVRVLLRRGELTGHRVGKGAEPRGIRVHTASVRNYKLRYAINREASPETGRRGKVATDPDTVRWLRERRIID